MPREITRHAEREPRKEIPQPLRPDLTMETKRSEITVNRKVNEPITLETTAHPTQASNELQEQIRLRAYELYEQRGGEDGRELDDWLQAEAEVTQSMTKAIAA